MDENLRGLIEEYHQELVDRLAKPELLNDERLAETYLDYIKVENKFPDNLNDVIPLHQIAKKKMGEDLYNVFYSPSPNWAIPGNGGSSSFYDWSIYKGIIINETLSIEPKFNIKVKEIITETEFRHQYKQDMIKRARYIDTIPAVPEMSWDDFFNILVSQNRNIRFVLPPENEFKVKELDFENLKTVQIIKIDQVPENISEPIRTHLFKANICKNPNCANVDYDYCFRKYCTKCGGVTYSNSDRDITRNTYFGSCFIGDTAVHYTSLDQRLSGTDIKVACLVKESNSRYNLLVLASEPVYPEDMVSWIPDGKGDVVWQIVKKIKERYKEVFHRDFIGMDIILYVAVLLRITNEMGYKKNILFVGKEGVGKTYAFRVACFCLTNPSLTTIMNCGRVSSSGLTGSIKNVKLGPQLEIPVRKPGLLTDYKMLVLDEYTGPDNKDSLDLRTLRNSLSENTVSYGLSEGTGSIAKKSSCVAIMNPPKKTESMVWQFLKYYSPDGGNRQPNMEEFHTLMSDKSSQLYKDYVKWAADKSEDYRTGMTGPDNDRFFLAFFCESPTEPPDRNPSAWDDLALKKKLWLSEVESFINKIGKDYYDFSAKISKKFDKRIATFAKELHKKNTFTSLGRIVEFTKTIAYGIMALNNQAIPDSALFQKINMIYQRAFNWKKPEEFEFTEEEIDFLENPVNKEDILKLLGIDEIEVSIIDYNTYIPRMA